MQKNYYKSILGQFAYVIVSGISLIFFPNFLLGLFGIEATNEIWIRVLGMLVLALSFTIMPCIRMEGKKL